MAFRELLSERTITIKMRPIALMLSINVLLASSKTHYLKVKKITSLLGIVDKMDISCGAPSTPWQLCQISLHSKDYKRRKDAFNCKASPGTPFDSQRDCQATRTLSGRGVTFHGDFDSRECGLTLYNVTKQDEGFWRWKCVTENIQGIKTDQNIYAEVAVNLDNAGIAYMLNQTSSGGAKFIPSEPNPEPFDRVLAVSELEDQTEMDSKYAINDVNVKQRSNYESISVLVIAIVSGSLCFVLVVLAFNIARRFYATSGASMKEDDVFFNVEPRERAESGELKRFSRVDSVIVV